MDGEKMKKLLTLLISLLILNIIAIGSYAQSNNRISFQQDFSEDNNINPLNLTGVLGLVYNEKTEEPIEDALIILYGIYEYETVIGNFKIKLPWIEKTRTNQDGFFNLNGIVGSKNTILIVKSGYRLLRHSFIYPSGEDSVWIDFYMKKFLNF
jgi:hypothetical protein